MTIQLPILRGNTLVDPLALVPTAARCWVSARKRGVPTQPSLHRLFARHDCGMLAPVFDSLLALYEIALGRGVAVGSENLSADEHMLLGLIDGSRTLAVCAGCSQGTTKTLACAIRSARAMMASVGRVGRGPVP